MASGDFLVGAVCCWILSDADAASARASDEACARDCDMWRQCCGYCCCCGGTWQQLRATHTHTQTHDPDAQRLQQPPAAQCAGRDGL